MRSRRVPGTGPTPTWFGRLTSALVHAEPDAPESPLRRTGLGRSAACSWARWPVAGFMVWA